MLNCLSIKDLLLFMSRHESKFIQDIIKDVLNKLDPKYINVSTHVVGIDPLVHTVSDFISTATDDVRLVGIHGMPGIGKTTIAKVYLINSAMDSREAVFFRISMKLQNNRMVLFFYKNNFFMIS